MQRCLPITTLLMMLATLAGCEAFGAAADVVAPAKTKAVFKPQDRVTLVLVDDPANRLGNPNLTDRISKVVEYELNQQKVVTQFVAMEDLHQLAQRRGREFAAMSLQDVGVALGADQVFHVHIEQVEVDTDPGAVRPQAWLRVKVLDVATGRRLFPAQAHATAGPSAGHAVHARMRQSVRPTENAGERVVLFTRFAEYLGQEIARLFYDYVPDPVGELGRDIRDAR